MLVKLLSGPLYPASASFTALVALILMMPLLCLYANVMGILGGMVVGVGMLNIGFIEYYNETAKAIKPDILVFYHTDGSVEPIIPDLIEVGVDILEVTR